MAAISARPAWILSFSLKRAYDSFDFFFVLYLKLSPPTRSLARDAKPIRVSSREHGHFPPAVNYRIRPRPSAPLIARSSSQQQQQQPSEYDERFFHFTGERTNDRIRRNRRPPSKRSGSRNTESAALLRTISAINPRCGSIILESESSHFALVPVAMRRAHSVRK